MSSIRERLHALGLTLPSAAAPAANYVPFCVSGSLVHIAGQLPKQEDGTLLHKGHLGKDVTVEQGYEAARLIGLHLLAQLLAACEGNEERIVRCVKLGGFVQTTDDFTQHPEVINGASDLLVEVMGDAGRHARFAVGAPSLPRGTSVEIDAIFEIRPA
ncbi:MAG: RidA family protein [Myxococcales bacterium]|nr:RidA family protein [Myxococcales bacterium]